MDRGITGRALKFVAIHQVQSQQLHRHNCLNILFFTIIVVFSGPGRRILISLPIFEAEIFLRLFLGCTEIISV